MRQALAGACAASLFVFSPQQLPAPIIEASPTPEPAATALPQQKATAPITEIPERRTPAHDQAAKPKPEGTIKGSSNKPVVSTKQPVHLVVRSDADARQIFSYFPYPTLSQSNITGTGTYRLTVDSQGAVTQIQILKRFGVRVADVTALKTFIRWRGKPGPMRIVDVGWKIAPRRSSR
jgi:TonB family C-terminal domain